MLHRKRGRSQLGKIILSTMFLLLTSAAAFSNEEYSMPESKKKILLDPEIEKSYSKGGEKERLLSGMFQVEKERTIRILKRFMPKPPAVVVDVGGAAGAYSFYLAGLGYKVHLIDPVPLHIQQADEEGRKISSPKLVLCQYLIFG